MPTIQFSRSGPSCLRGPRECPFALPCTLHVHGAVTFGCERELGEHWRNFNTSFNFKFNFCVLDFFRFNFFIVPSLCVPVVWWWMVVGWLDRYHLSIQFGLPCQVLHLYSKRVVLVALIESVIGSIHSTGSPCYSGQLYRVARWKSMLAQERTRIACFESGQILQGFRSISCVDLYLLSFFSSSETQQWPNWTDLVPLHVSHLLTLCCHMKNVELLQLGHL